MDKQVYKEAEKRETYIIYNRICKKAVIKKIILVAAFY